MLGTETCSNIHSVTKIDTLEHNIPIKEFFNWKKWRISVRKQWKSWFSHALPQIIQSSCKYLSMWNNFPGWEWKFFSMCLQITTYLKSLERTQRYSGERNEDRVNWQDNSLKKVRRIVQWSCIGMCAGWLQRSLQRNNLSETLGCNWKQRYQSGTQYTVNAVQTLEELSVCYVKFLTISLCSSSTFFIPLYTAESWAARAYTSCKGTC